MKNQKLIFILIGVFVVLFISACFFFALQGLSAAYKKQEYFDFYRDKAEEYIKSDSEMLSEYGNDISVEFDNSATYRKSNLAGNPVWLLYFSNYRKLRKSNLAVYIVLIQEKQR